MLDNAPCFTHCVSFKLYKIRNWFQSCEHGPGCQKVASFGLISEGMATELLLNDMKQSVLLHQPDLCVPLSEASRWNQTGTYFIQKHFRRMLKETWGEVEPIQWPTFPRHPGAQGLIEQPITLIQNGLGKPWRATATCKICSRQTLTLSSFLPSEIWPYSRESHVFFFTSGSS